MENLEGYPESLRYLRKNSPSTSQAPLFSEILNCPAEYKSAIENYLDPFMNYFVIDQIEEASRAVNVLSEAAKGRANFFILKNFEDTPVPAFEQVSDCMPALSIIDIAEKYRPLCNHLLRNVYVVTENQENTPFLQQDNKSSFSFPKMENIAVHVTLFPVVPSDCLMANELVARNTSRISAKKLNLLQTDWNA